MRQAQITLRLLVAATLGWAMLWVVVAPAMAQSTPEPAQVTITVVKLFCVDDDRTGDVEFQVGTAPDAIASDVEINECTATIDDDDAEEPTFTLTDVEGGQGKSGQAVEGVVVLPEVLLGTYTLSEEFEEREPVTSEPFTLVGGGELDITVINFIAGPPATVQVDKVFCVDGERKGEVDFFVQVDDEDFSAEAVATDCRPADKEEARFTLSQPEEESLGPEETDAEGTAIFEEVLPGAYVMTEVESEAESDPFEVVNGDERPTTRVLVINYVAPDPTDEPSETPSGGGAKPTKTPVSGGGQTPKPTNTPTSGGGGGGGSVVNPPAVTQRTPVPIATTPSRTGAVVRSSPIAVTALPSTGEGSVDVAPLSTITMMLLGALTLIALGISMFRRRAG